MRPFMDENFLLTTDTARALYHDVARDMPIYDYHCHLIPTMIAENAAFDNVGQMMLQGDHYKWRAMAACGEEQRVIRGDADDHEKFLAYARMLPNAIGSPLYHWTHLEFQRVFGIDTPLCPATAEDIWNRANALLQTDAFRARGIIERFRVKVICTTDDPADDLAAHRAMAADESFRTRVLPAFRPDKAINADATGFAAYIKRLSAAAGVSIHSVDDVIDALTRRLDFFHALGARVSDHALDTVPFAAVKPKRAEEALHDGLHGETPDAKSLAHYRTAILLALSKEYHKRGWAQQYHINAMRNNNAAAFAQFGPDTGYDAMQDQPVAWNLAHLLDAQASAGHLPKTILYSLNPAAHDALAAITGVFQEAGAFGKMQLGSAWWFCDTKLGMTRQLTTLADMGVLGTFIGMLTDSRSFLSYPRHEYFRRVLCELLGGWVENGEYPADMDQLSKIVRGICFDNARDYFGIPLND